MAELGIVVGEETEYIRSTRSLSKWSVSWLDRGRA